jgi:hypothetical protein
VVVARVPWARHGSGFIRAFEDQVAWLATPVPPEPLQPAHAGGLADGGQDHQPCCGESFARPDRLDGLTKIGIDGSAGGEGRGTSAVTDQVTGRLVWAAEGRSRDTVKRFFTALGKPRSRLASPDVGNGPYYSAAAGTVRSPGPHRSARRSGSDRRRVPGGSSISTPCCRHFGTTAAAPPVQRNQRQAPRREAWRSVGGDDQDLQQEARTGVGEGVQHDG